MTSHTGKQTTTIHILPDNKLLLLARQEVKVIRQLNLEQNIPSETLFFKNQTKDETKRPVLEPFFLVLKACVQHLSFIIYFDSPRLGHTI